MHRIDLAKEAKAKSQNLKSNLEFIDFYVEYLKGKSNKECARLPLSRRPLPLSILAKKVELKRASCIPVPPFIPGWVHSCSNTTNISD